MVAVGCTMMEVGGVTMWVVQWWLGVVLVWAKFMEVDGGLPPVE